jgi:hypothetical protein
LAHLSIVIVIENSQLIGPVPDTWGALACGRHCAEEQFTQPDGRLEQTSPAGFERKQV